MSIPGFRSGEREVRVGERRGEERQFYIFFNLATAFIPNDNGEGKIEEETKKGSKLSLACFVFTIYLSQIDFSLF